MIYFASGASAPADLRGLVRIGHDLGVSLPELSEPALRELLTIAGARLPAVEGSRLLSVLVDTGAFSEVEIRTGRPVVVRPIDEAGWGWRLRTMLRIARALGPQAYCVAPDRVGDQGHTLALLTRWARWVRKLRRLGARVVVPIQQGATSPAAFDRACTTILGFDDYVRAIPANKAAFTSARLESFLRETRPVAVHLLGIGPRNPRLPALRELLRRFVPSAEISCDSNLLAANVGLTNGAGGGPRVLTAAEHGIGWQERKPDGSYGPKVMDREQAIAMTLGVRLRFERMSRTLAAQGVYFDGFERVGDGLWPRGFVKVVPPQPHQLGLFDEQEDPRR